jgi:N-acyl-D-aspartate/D-glutamate deacylase
MAVSTPANKRYESRALVDIARERNQHPLDTACDLLVEEAGRVLVFFAMAQPDDALTEASTFAPLKHPEVSISTDTLITGLGKPSHLFHGCYPRFLGRYVREKKMLSLEIAIRKMTSVPAEHFKLRQRGQLQTAYHADIVVFDPQTISSKANFLHPDTPPIGISLVFINGHKIVDGGIAAQGRYGQVLRHN